jgi:hypothetical protein
MMNGAHVVLFSADTDADSAYYRDVIAFKAADADAVGWCSRCRRPRRAHILRKPAARRIS